MRSAPGRRRQRLAPRRARARPPARLAASASGSMSNAGWSARIEADLSRAWPSSSCRRSPRREPPAAGSRPRRSPRRDSPARRKFSGRPMATPGAAGDQRQAGAGFAEGEQVVVFDRIDDGVSGSLRPRRPAKSARTASAPWRTVCSGTRSTLCLGLAAEHADADWDRASASADGRACRESESSASPTKRWPQIDGAAVLREGRAGDGEGRRRARPSAHRRPGRYCRASVESKVEQYLKKNCRAPAAVSQSSGGERLRDGLGRRNRARSSARRRSRRRRRASPARRHADGLDRAHAAARPACWRDRLRRSDRRRCTRAAASRPVPCVRRPVPPHLARAGRLASMRRHEKSGPTHNPQESTFACGKSEARLGLLMVKSRPSAWPETQARPRDAARREGRAAGK